MEKVKQRYPSDTRLSIKALRELRRNYLTPALVNAKNRKEYCPSINKLLSGILESLNPSKPFPMNLIYLKNLVNKKKKKSCTCWRDTVTNLNICPYCTHTRTISVNPTCGHSIHKTCAYTLILNSLYNKGYKIENLPSICCNTPIGDRIESRDSLRPCIQCKDPSPSRGLFEIQCGHHYCLDCLQVHLYDIARSRGWPTDDTPCPYCRSSMGPLRIDRTHLEVQNAIATM